MGSAVDAVRPAGDHRDVPLGQPRGEIGGDVLAVRCCGPGSDDRTSAFLDIGQCQRPHSPQHQRRMALGASSHIDAPE
jgi:hypothetical protein